MTDAQTHPTPRLAQILGRLGLYSTYVAAALFLIVIAGDLAVLVRHVLLQGWLALLVGVGPLVALLLSTLASYINYYGVWRIVRGKDEFDAKEDLKSHAADAPQAAHALLAGRAGCLPSASTALLFCSLLLVLATILPQQAPLIGALGGWSGRVGALVLIPGGEATTPPAAPTSASVAPTATSDIAVTPTPTAAPKPTVTPNPSTTATPRPTLAPTPVIAFSISPTSASSYACVTGGPLAQPITLDNGGSAIPISWSASQSGSAWAVVSPSSGVAPAHGQQDITLNPNSSVCASSSPGGTAWVVTIMASGAGSFTFTYIIYGPAR